MLRQGLDFSFSGLKTAVLRAVRASADLEADRADLARTFRTPRSTCWSPKTVRALDETGAETAVIAGGVACNRPLRTALDASGSAGGRPRRGRIAPLNTDNAAMIAAAGGRGGWPAGSAPDSTSSPSIAARSRAPNRVTFRHDDRLSLNLHVGPLNITGYGVMMMVGFLMGGWLMDREIRRRGWNSRLRRGHDGRRGDRRHSRRQALVRGGHQDIGALSQPRGPGVVRRIHRRRARGAAATAGASRCRCAGPGDLGAGAPAAYALGRIGCFLVGDDYGRPTSPALGRQVSAGHSPPTTADQLTREFGVDDFRRETPPDRCLAVHPPSSTKRC
jgi:hypothetical protein